MRFDFESLDATGNPAVIFRGIVGSRAVGGVRAARPAAEAEYSREKEQKSQLGN